MVEKKIEVLLKVSEVNLSRAKKRFDNGDMIPPFFTPQWLLKALRTQ